MDTSGEAATEVADGAAVGILSVYYTLWYKRRMSKNLITGFAVVAIALFVSACQPKVEPTPTPEPTQQEAMVLPASEGSTSADVSQTSPDLGEIPEGATVLSTTETYQSPGGPEEVGFSLVVDQQGTIVAAATTILGKSPTTQLRQTSFSEEFPDAVKGKMLADLGPLDRVGGSSLTTGAFNQALADLQTQL